MFKWLKKVEELLNLQERALDLQERLNLQEGKDNF